MVSENSISLQCNLLLVISRGLSIVGKVAVFMTFFIIAPFVVMGVMAIPQIDPGNWIICDLKAVQWGPFINVMFWYAPRRAAALPVLLFLN